MAYNDTEFSKIALERGWIKDDSGWKEILKSSKKNIINYEPFKLDLWGERKKIYRLLYFTPKWWLIILNTLIRNRSLIIPIIGTLIRRIYDKNII